jgi:hypothetical protein
LLILLVIYYQFRRERIIVDGKIGLAEFKLIQSPNWGDPFSCKITFEYNSEQVSNSHIVGFDVFPFGYKVYPVVFDEAIAFYTIDGDGFVFCYSINQNEIYKKEKDALIQGLLNHKK